MQDNVSTFGLVSLAVCVLAFAVFYMMRVHSCAKGLLQASRSLHQHNMLTDEELRGFGLNPPYIRWTFLLLALVPVLAMALVIVAVNVR